MLAQRLEQQTHNLLVGGSNPSRPTHKKPYTLYIYVYGFFYLLSRDRTEPTLPNTIHMRERLNVKIR